MKTAKLLWVLGLTLGVFNASAQTAGAPTVTVGVAPSTDMALMIVAVKQGFLQKEGLNAQLQVFDSSPAAPTSPTTPSRRSWRRGHEARRSCR